MEEISFVVINRNNQTYLNSCLESIDKLKYNKIEIILVDDCSTDNSLQALTSNPNHVIRHTKNRGIAVSRNDGLNMAKSNIVFVIDSDIQITKLNVSKIFKLFGKDEKIVAISGMYYSKDIHNGNKILDARRKYLFGKNKRELIYGFNNYTTFSGGFCVINKSRLGKVFQKGKLFVGGEDILFQLRLMNKGCIFAYSPHLKGIHHHKRNFWKTILKAKNEAKGNIWLIEESLKEGLTLPVFVSVFPFPIFFLSGIVLKQPILLFLEFLPILYLLAKNRQVIFLQLLAYELIWSVFQVYYSFHFIFKDFPIKIKIRYLYHMLKCDIIGKYAWLKNNYEANNTN